MSQKSKYLTIGKYNRGSGKPIQDIVRLSTINSMSKLFQTTLNAKALLMANSALPLKLFTTPTAPTPTTSTPLTPYKLIALLQQHLYILQLLVLLHHFLANIKFSAVWTTTIVHKANTLLAGDISKMKKLRRRPRIVHLLNSSSSQR